MAYRRSYNGARRNSCMFLALRKVRAAPPRALYNAAFIFGASRVTRAWFFSGSVAAGTANLCEKIN